MEITISARGRNIPTQVHPLGSARFAVSFVPMEGVDHTINITFNKDLVPGAPFTAKIHTGKKQQYHKYIFIYRLYRNNPVILNFSNILNFFLPDRPQPYHRIRAIIGGNRSWENVLFYIIKRYWLSRRH